MKKITCLFMFILFIGISLFSIIEESKASIARLQGMALDEETSWMLSRDFAYIGINPAYTALFNQMLWAAWTNSGSDNNASGALLLVPMEKLALAIRMELDR